jgi:hypothetical protein
MSIIRKSVEGLVEHEARKHYGSGVRDQVIELLARGASPLEISKRFGISRKTVATWKRRYVTSSNTASLKVAPASSLGALSVVTPATTMPASIAVPRSPVSPVLPAPLPATAGDAKTSQISPRGHIGLRWFECQECGGEFEYLRRGGTCRACDLAING